MMRPALPDISLRQLEYLVAVADSDTWAEAAQRIGVSASALSQGLAELERRVGIELFEANGRRRVLRPSAQPVLDHARQVIAATRDLIGWSERVQGGTAGKLAVGMVDVAAVVYFSDVVRRFRAERPGLELRLTVAPSASLLGGLRDATLDLIVCVDPPSPIVGVTTQPLVVEPMTVLAPVDGRRFLATPDRWGPWVTFPHGSHTRTRISDAVGRLGARFDVLAESHQPGVLIEMVRMGLGWTVLPVATNSLPEGIIVGPRVGTRELVIVRRDGLALDPAADALVDLLRTAARRIEPGSSNPGSTNNGS